MKEKPELTTLTVSTDQRTRGKNVFIFAVKK